MLPARGEGQHRSASFPRLRHGGGGVERAEPVLGKLVEAAAVERGKPSIVNQILERGVGRELRVETGMIIYWQSGS